MKKTINIKISVETLRQIQKMTHRESLIENNLYAIPTHKVFKSDKTYTRKKKYKVDYTS